MNAQAVLRLLEQPALLSEHSMADLLELVREFPYAKNLRLLVLLKARQVQDPNFEQYLNRFAAATFDRGHLFNLLEAIEKREEDKGEVLELLELEELELADFGAPFEELPSRLNEAAVPENPFFREDEDAPFISETKPVPPGRDEPAARPPSEAVSSPSPSDWPQLADAFLDLIPSPPPSPPETVAETYGVGEVRPDDPERFSDVVAARRREVPLEVRLRKLRRPDRPAVAGDSTVDHGAVVSETLAALLVRQGQLQHAIKMYRRLILLYPDKKPIFADLIKDLKEKL